MTINIQNSPYLRNQRTFPPDTQGMVIEMDKAYVDIANNVNARIIGNFPVSVSSVTGESWYLNGSRNRQQTLRQVFQVTSTSPITHNIPVTQIAAFTKCYGSFSDAPTSTDYYGLIYASNVAIAGQTGFYITPTQIVFTVGAGSPVLTSGLIVLEWLSVV